MKLYTGELDLWIEMYKSALVAWSQNPKSIELCKSEDNILTNVSVYASHVADKFIEHLRERK